MVSAPRLFSVLTLAVLAGCGRTSPELPSIGGWTGEPQVAEAIDEAQRAALREPTAANLGRLGEIFHAHALYPEALTCYRQAAELAPEEARWPYLAALATRKTDLEPSLELFELAIERGAGHPALFIHLGDTLDQLGRSEEAAARYGQALAVDSESTHALHGLARIALTSGETERAVEHLERAREIAPWHGDVRLLLARTYQRLGRVEEAERELLVAGAFPDPTQASDPILQVVEARAVNSAALVDRARRLARVGRFQDAETLYRRVLAIRPGTASDYANLGGALARQGRTAEAIAAYHRALELEPEHADALNNLALALADNGDLDGAARHLERALAAEPANAQAHRNLGLVRARQGRNAAAVSHYREALRHDPSFVEAHNDLGTALGTLGDTEAARASWRLALAIDPHELSAIYNLSVSLSGDGRHEEAVDWLERGIEIAPNSSRLATLLAWELATSPRAELRDAARAERLARRVYESYRTQPRAGDVYAASLAAVGRFEQAVEIAGGAMEQAAAGGDLALARQIGARLSLYRRGSPYHQAE